MDEIFSEIEIIIQFFDASFQMLVAEKSSKSSYEISISFHTFTSFSPFFQHIPEMVSNPTPSANLKQLIAGGTTHHRKTLWLWLTVRHGIDGPNRNRGFIPFLKMVILIFHCMFSSKKSPCLLLKIHLWPSPCRYDRYEVQVPPWLQEAPPPRALEYLNAGGQRLLQPRHITTMVNSGW